MLAPLLCVSLRTGSQEASTAARLFTSDWARKENSAGSKGFAPPCREDCSCERQRQISEPLDLAQTLIEAVRTHSRDEGNMGGGSPL